MVPVAVDREGFSDVVVADSAHDWRYVFASLESANTSFSILNTHYQYQNLVSGHQTQNIKRDSTSDWDCTCRLEYCTANYNTYTMSSPAKSYVLCIFSLLGGGVGSSTLS